MRTLFNLLPALFVLVSLCPGRAQTLELEWLKTNKMPRGQAFSTQALLRAGPEGFYLLQRGGTTMHVATLKPTGELVRRDSLPDFNARHGCLASLDSLLLVVRQRGVTLEGDVVNIVNGRRRTPVTLEALRATAGPGRFTGIAAVRSAGGGRTCVYALADDRVVFFVFDERFNLLWKGALEPGTDGAHEISRVVCTDAGDVVVQAAFYPESAPLVSLSPGTFVPGTALMRAASLGEHRPGVAPRPVNTVLAVLRPGAPTEPVWFDLDTRKHFVGSSLFAEAEGGAVAFVALLTDWPGNAAKDYLVYSLDPAAVAGKMLYRGPLPAALQPEDRDDGWRLYLRRAHGTARQPLTVLAEYQRPGPRETEWQFGELVVARIDSVGRLRGVKRVEKFQSYEAPSLTDLSPFARGSVAACPQANGGWWLFWNKNEWPNAEFWWADSKKGEPQLLKRNSGLYLAMLPHTALFYAGKWWFTGESAAGDAFGVGSVGKNK